jgi:hypothetical protein
MKIKIIYPPKFENEKRYIVETVFSHFLNTNDFILEFSNDINPKECHLIYEGHPSSKLLILNNNFFDLEEDMWLKEGSLPKEPIEYLKIDGLEGKFINNIIPVLYGKTSGRIILESENTIHCDIDLFGGMFFFLTLYEEVVISKFDNHNRFNYLDSIIFKSKLYLRPVVNEYLEILKALILKIGFDSANDKRKYQLILSHDVDVPFSYNASFFYFIRNITADLILRKSVSTFLKKLGARILPGKKLKYKLDPNNNFRYLMTISEKYSIKSFFNFIMINGRGNIDGNYEISDEYFLELLSEINKRGHIIGIHPSYETFDNFQLLFYQYDKLKKILNKLEITSTELGGRQHFLRWRNPETWQIWEDCGLKYDSSLGSEYFMGFRCGTCYEFPVFNLLNSKALRLIEYPLLVMDICAFKTKSKQIREDAILDISKICRYYNGNMTFLFHNNYAVTKIQKASYEHLISKLI